MAYSVFFYKDIYSVLEFKKFMWLSNVAKISSKI